MEYHSLLKIILVLKVLYALMELDLELTLFLSKMRLLYLLWLKKEEFHSSNQISLLFQLDITLAVLIGELVWTHGTQSEILEVQVGVNQDWFVQDVLHLDLLLILEVVSDLQQMLLEYALLWQHLNEWLFKVVTCILSLQLFIPFCQS